MAVTLRSGRELDERRVERKNTEEEKQAEIGEEHEHNSSEAIFNSSIFLISYHAVFPTLVVA